MSAAGAGRQPEAPLVAVLCTESRARAATAAVALSLAQVAGRRCALAGAVGASAGAALGAMPAARRQAAALQRRGLPAHASGRLVWLADRRGPLAENDLPPRCAALSAELGRSAGGLAVPAAVAFPCVRSEALDRVLAWHDAIVVVREPGALDGVIEHALASLARLGRPVGVVDVPSRMPGALAAAGFVAPAEVTRAVGELLAGGLGSRRRDD